MDRVERVKPHLPVTFHCACGRPFTKTGPKKNHERACAVAKAVAQQQLDAFLDSLDRARARLAAGDRGEGRIRGNATRKPEWTVQVCG